MFKETMIFICIKLSESFLWKKLTLTIKQNSSFCVYFKYAVTDDILYIPSAFVTRAEPDSGLSIAFALDFCVFKHFVYVPTKYDAAIHKKKPRIGLSLPYIVHACISVEKQYQMTHTARTYISDPLCIP